jgi:hydrogenase maturation protease
MARGESARALRLVLIGYGNPLRSDDGVGWRAAEELSRSLEFPGVAVASVVSHQLMPELAHDFKDADAVFFIDATREGQPGEVKSHPVIAEPWIPYSHACSPAALLGLGRELYGARPQAYAVTLCGECFDHGEGFSATARASLPRLTALVEKLSIDVIAQLGTAEPFAETLGGSE